MICLAYLSSATRSIDPEALGVIVESARRNNTALGITGMLCHFDGSFLQFLEGEERAVADLYAAIARDPRHTQLLQVYRKPISHRVFGDWTMAVVKVDEISPAQRAFCNSLRQVELAGTAEHLMAITPFLDSFRAWIR